MNEERQVSIETSKFKTRVTNTGLAKLAGALPEEKRLAIKSMGFGDANGESYEPDITQTEMIHECYRSDVTDYKIMSESPTQILVQGEIPPAVGYFRIAEVGVFDEEGELIAVANMDMPKYPDTTGMGSALKVNLIINFENDVTGNIVFNFKTQVIESITLKEIQEITETELEFNTITVIGDAMSSEDVRLFLDDDPDNDPKYEDEPEEGALSADEILEILNS